MLQMHGPQRYVILTKVFNDARQVERCLEVLSDMQQSAGLVIVL